VRLELVQVGHHRQRGVFVLLAFSKLQQFGGLGQAVQYIGDAGDGLVQQGTFPAQGLGILGVVPDIRVFEFAGYFFQTFFLDVVVKDTP